MTNFKGEDSIDRGFETYDNFENRCKRSNLGNGIISPGFVGLSKNSIEGIKRF
jgi:hypothetical protein